MKRALVSAAAIALVGGSIATGCGGDDNDGSATTTQADTTASGGGAPQGESVEIKMGDFFFDPKNVTAQAGTTTINAPNDGNVEHELVLFKTNTDPAKLPTDPGGGVDEEKLWKAGGRGRRDRGRRGRRERVGHIRSDARQVRDVLQPPRALRPGHVRLRHSLEVRPKTRAAPASGRSPRSPLRDPS